MIGSATKRRRLGALDRTVRVVMAITLAIMPVAAQAQQLPTGGVVAAGSASIATPSNGTLNINQSSNRAVINWDSFSIGQGGTVNFNQPGASSATLNRVTGATPSSIAGAINAPGTVLLVNPNGIAISKTGVVNVGSFAASTLGIKDADFMAGNYKFTGNGASASVTNAGRINVSDGGFAALLGGRVANDGVITARLGRVGLGSGELITLDLSGDGFLSVGVPTSALGSIVDGTGKALVSNRGKIVANGGIVHLSAATAAGILRDAVNVPGSIRANSVGTRNGRIIIGGGAGGRVSVAGHVRANGGRSGNGGTVSVSGAAVEVAGKVTATGRKGGSVTIAGDQSVDIWGTVSTRGKTDAGGNIIVTANDIRLAGEAVIDASGTTGGTVLVGGDYQGGANAANNFVSYPILNAMTTSVAAGAQIRADGSAGNGGKVVVWSDDQTSFAGAISAMGAGGGQGGFAEVSGHRLLDFTGTADLKGPGGFGTLLLDPRNVTISSGTGSGGALASGTFTPSADNSILNVATLQTALASGNVVVTTGSTGSQSGDITVASAIAWSSANSLTLTAAHDVNINAAITAASGGLVINATNAATATAAINVGSFTLQSGAWTQNSATLPSFAAGNFTISGGSFLRVAGGSGSSGTPYQIADVYGLQGMFKPDALSSVNFALANDIDASGTANWNSGAGFAPIGASGTVYIDLDGNYHTISGLTINRSGSAGLFAKLAGVVEHLTLAGGSVIGTGSAGAVAGTMSPGSQIRYVTSSVNVQSTGGNAGGLVGMASSNGSVSVFSASSSSGNVSGTGRVGGLVGSISDALFSGVHATGSVTSTGAGGFAGGLVGVLGGNSVSAVAIYSSYATGAVTGETTGGLVGKFLGEDISGFGLITNSYASGAVTGTTLAGGLVGTFGYHGSDINTLSNSYASGSVNAPTAGGLVGDAGVRGAISSSYSSGAVTASTAGGGLVGTNAGSVQNSYAVGAVSGSGTLGGLLGLNSGTVATSYASGAVSGGATMGGLAGQNTGTVGSNVYWDTGTTTRSAGYGTNTGTFSAAGLTTAQARTQSCFTGTTCGGAGGWDFTGTWYMVDGQTRPFLRSEYSTTITNPHQLQLATMNLGANYTVANDIALGTTLANASDMWGSAGFVPIGTLATSFTGTFNGNSHTISGLIINRPTTQYVGLFGYVGASGNVNNLGVTGTVTGQDIVGMLAGDVAGTLSNVYATGTLSGQYQVGGLVGILDPSGTISLSHANVAVTGAHDDIGGLVGQSAGAISQSYAGGSVVVPTSGANYSGGLVGHMYAGSITQSFATGAVNGGGLAGGLVGGMDAGTITQAYATGSVNAKGARSGGLLGAYVGGAVSEVYATGYGTGGGSNLFGLVPSNTSLTNGYWDTQTSGLASNAYGTGTAKTTAQLQAALPSGFNASVWGIVAGASYPFFLWQYPSAGGAPQVISGNAYADFSLAKSAGATVSGLVNGVGVGATSAGANGYFNLLLAPNTITSNSQVAVYTTGATAGLSYHQNVSGSISGAAIYGNNLNETSSATTMSAISSGLATAIGSSGVATTYASRSLDLYGGTFSIDQAITQSGSLRLVAAANVTQTAGSAITANAFFVASGSGSVTLTDSGNQFSILGSASVNFGSLSIYDSVSLGLGYVYAGGPISIRTAGALSLGSTITSAASGNAIVLAAGTTFSSPLQGSGALSLTGGGRFLIYSQDPANDNVGGLTGGKIYSSTYAANPPASISASGNQFIYASAAPFTLLTYTVGNASSTYGTLATLGAVTLSGNPSGVSGVVSLYDSGNNLVTLSAALAAGTYTGKVTSLSGANAAQYQIAGSGNTVGTLIINQAPLTVTASNRSKTYGTTLSLGTTAFTTGGTLYDGDTLTSATLASTGAAGTANVAGSPYAITASNATGTGLSNYAISYVNGALTVNQAALTVTASNRSKTYGTTLSLGSTAFTTSYAGTWVMTE